MNETYNCNIMSRDFVIWWYCDFNFLAVITYGFSFAYDLIHTHPNYIYLYCITAIKPQISYFQLALTTSSLVFFIFDIYFLYLHILQENSFWIQQANKYSRSQCLLFRKRALITPTFANKCVFVWLFSYSHLSSP